MRLNTCRLMAAAWMSKILFGMSPNPKELLGELGELGGDEVDDLWKRIASGTWGFFATNALGVFFPVDSN